MGWKYLDVPVIDGIATLPDGTQVRSSSNVVRVPIAEVDDGVPPAGWYGGPDCGVDGCEREVGHTGDHAPYYSLDDAWADAEAALPEGWALVGVKHDPCDGVEFYAWATTSRAIEWGAEGPTPAAALRALTVQLRERAG